MYYYIIVHRPITLFFGKNSNSGGKETRKRRLTGTNSKK